MEEFQLNNDRKFGAPLKRKEDRAFLTGKGRYVDDIVMPNMAYAAFVRSPFGHARIKGVDKSAAESAQGVLAVLCHRDLPQSLQDDRLPLFVAVAALTQPKMQYVLAKDEVCYVGEIVAIVVAENRYLAEDAAERVHVDYEQLAAVSDCRAALEPDAPRVHLDSENNVAARMPSVIGDIEAAFHNARHIFREQIYQHRGGSFSMECRGCVINYDPVQNGFVVYASLQAPHRIKRGMLEMFAVSDSQVRIVSPDVGGGFGPKGNFYAEYPAVAAAAMAVGRPVKWIEDRHENFVATHQERDQYWDVEIAVDDDAKILGVRGTLVHDNGAYTPWGIVLPWISVTTVPGPYVLPAFRIDLVSVLTNKVPCTPVRGAGRPQAVVVMERLMDRVARELKLDPAEVRRRNFIKPEQMPYDVGIVFRDGRVIAYDSGDYPACQESALKAVDYEGFKARQQVARTEGRYIGIGIGNAVEATGLGPYEGATLRIGANGKIVVYTGAAPQGQSHKTTLAQIAADHFNVEIDDVLVETADTAGISLGIGSFAARTAVNAGSSVHIAAGKVAEKLKQIAAEMMKVRPEELELKDGRVFIPGHNGDSRSFKEVAIQSIGMPGFSMPSGREPGLEHTAYFTPEASTFANGTAVAEVEVDIETGRVKITRLVIAHDCGRIINPLVVDGQVIGGAIHGVGNALYERMVHDSMGQPLSTTFGEYLLPLAADSPRVEVIHHVSPSPRNPLGLKGAGEGGTIPTTAAVLGAVENALSPFGVKITESPISPERIVRLLGEAALGRTA